MRVWFAVALLSATVKGASLAIGWNLQNACVSDDRNSRLFTTKVSDNATGQTINGCLEQCASQKMKYAGIEHGTQCWCSASLNTKVAGKSLPATSCQVSCSGDSSSKCGGSWAAALYSYTAPTVPSGWALKSACVADSKSPRLMETKAVDPTVTAIGCVSYCNGQGYSYAGTQHGNECWCANTLNTAGGGGGSSTACNYDCSGDAFQQCGGRYAIRLYQKTQSSTPPATNPPGSTGQNHYVLGGSANNAAPSSVATRMNIKDFIQNKYYWSLFVQAVSTMQKIFNTDPNYCLGHYALGAIHGEPFISWNGSFTTERASAGYCPHGTNIFPTWHRPYTAMYEQIMRDLSILIADSYSVDAANFKAAADTIRFPYWDWAIDATPPEELISYQTLSVTGAQGNTISIPNPFTSFNFQGDNSNLDPNWSGYQSTVRYPQSSNPLGDLRKNLKSLQPQNLQHVQQMFQYVNTWDGFSNHNADAANQDKSNSLESIHDSIHIVTGGNGHFGDPAVAGFDPMFFFHHSQVDRLLALWQSFNPNTWVDQGVTNQNTQTRYLATDDIVNSQTGLAPFWSSQSGYWTSDSARSTSTLQYTYPEFVGTSSNNDVISRVQKLYNFGPGSTSKRAEEKKENCTKNDLVSAISKTVDNILHQKHYDWSVRIRFQAAELGRSFAVHTFLGNPPNDSTSYMQANGYIGSAFAFNRMKSGDMVTQSFVQISDLLVNLASVASLDPDVVTPLLKSQLQWRITESDLVTPIDVSKLPSLEVLVMAAIVTPVQVTKTKAFRAKPLLYPNVTTGKRGGSSHHHHKKALLSHRLQHAKRDL